MNRLRLSTLSLTMAIVVMTLGYVNVASAVKPTCPGDHPSCKTDDGADGATFSVLIIGADGFLAGSSGENHWVQGFGGKNAIGLNDASPAGLVVGTLDGLSMFTVQPAACFPENFFAPHTAFFQLHQAIIKPGKKGRAEASFWFHGATFQDNVRVLYVLKLFGTFNSPMDWPSAQDLTMTDWELKVENEGKAIKSISCQGDGEGSVTIEVTLET